MLEKRGAWERELTVDEGVEDRHSTVGDTSVGVDLLQDWKWKLANEWQV